VATTVPTFEDCMRILGSRPRSTELPQSLVQFFNEPGHDIDPDDYPDDTPEELVARADPNRLFLKRAHEKIEDCMSARPSLFLRAVRKAKS